MEILYLSINYLGAFLLGYFLAFSELLSRYRIFRLIFSSVNAWTYLLINGAASMVSYYFIRKFNIHFGELTTSELGKVLLAGLSAMFILRSSFFSYYDKDSNKTVNVGIAAILQTFLDAAERSFDQEQSVGRLKDVEEIMKDGDFNKASVDLTITCLNLMQNVSSEEQKKLAESIKTLSENSNTNNFTKSINLGIILSKITGIKLLKQAVSTHGQSIKISPVNKEIFANLEALKGKIR